MNALSAHPLTPGITLVLGGTRSGKSAFAEGLACQHAPRVYLATAESSDPEMARRIEKHQSRRGEGWRLIEAPYDLGAAIERESPDAACIVVDCLTVWLGNLMYREHDIDTAREALLASLAAARSPIILVASEVGLGIVPDNAMARAFRDHAGTLNQAVAAAAQTVYFVAAGLPMTLKHQE